VGQIDNGVTVYGPDNTEPSYEYNTVAEHHCNDGYYLVGESTQQCRDNGTGVIGTWDGTYPACYGEWV